MSSSNSRFDELPSSTQQAVVRLINTLACCSTKSGWGEEDNQKALKDCYEQVNEACRKRMLEEAEKKN